MIEFIFESCINIIENLISVDFITRYLGAKYNGKKKNLAFLIAWAVDFIEITIVNHITKFETIGAYIPIIIYVCYAFICLNGSKLLKLWIAILTQIIVLTTAIVANILVCYIIGYKPYDMIMVFNGTRVIGVIVAKIMQFCTARILLKNKYRMNIGNSMIAAIIIIPSVSVISLSALMKAILINNDIFKYAAIGIVCIVIANIMTYYFFALINKEYENKIKTKLLEQQNENLRRNIADKEVFVKEMKAVRHDIKNQLLTIFQYADEGKINDIKKYINVLTNSHLSNVLNYINTDNVEFDAIMNSKIAICNSDNIFIEVKVKEGTDINIQSGDITALFGNLLDNAIEAAKCTKEKRISVDIQKNNEYLIISVSNSIEESILDSNKNLETSKKDKELHGIGLQSVRHIVEKYNGMIQFYEEENEFYCHIMLERN